MCRVLSRVCNRGERTRRELLLVRGRRGRGEPEAETEILKLFRNQCPFTEKARRAGLRPAPAVAAAALQGIENLSDVAAHRLEPGIVLRHPCPEFPVCLLKPGIALLHPGEDLADVLPVLLVQAPVLFEFTPVFCNLVHLPQDDLAQVPDHARYPDNLTPQVVNPRPHFGKPSGGPVHVIAQNPREPFQRQSIVRIGHRVPPLRIHSPEHRLQ